jgi:integrase
MSSVFKKTSDRKRPNSCWYIAYTDHDGVRRTKKGCPDKTATEALARKLESDAELRRRGVIDPKADAYRFHQSRPLAEHLADWKAFQLGKGVTQRHADEGYARVVKLVALAKAERLSDLTLARLQAALALLRGMGLALRTIHHHVRLVKNFSRWLWRDGRTREDLLAHLQLPENPESDRRRERRALTDGELIRLIDAAEQGAVRCRLSGPDRAMLYRIAAGTGYRSEELQSLTPESFALEGAYPTITVEAGNSKRRRRDVQPIQPALAAMLAPWVAARPKGKPIFPVSRWAILTGLQADLRSAGIAYTTDEGTADFHALRHTYITALAKSNAPVKIVQTLARHSTPVLMLGVYTHVGLYDQAPALDALPDLTRPAPRSEPTILAPTGTDSATFECHKVAAQGKRAGDGLRRNESGSDVMAGSDVAECMNVSSGKTEGFDGSCRVLTCPDALGSVSAAGARPGLQNR